MQQARLTLVAAAVCVALRTSEGYNLRNDNLEEFRCISRKTHECESAILPIASSCCTEVSHHVSRRLLERVNACSIQRADGDCDLAAVILHVKRRRICVSPHNHMLRRWMRASQVKTGKGNPCRKSDRKSHTPRKHGSQSHKAPATSNIRETTPRQPHLTSTKVKFKGPSPDANNIEI